MAMGDNRLMRYISSLSEEERREFKPLIDEALERDRALTESIREAKRNVARYEESSRRLATTATELTSALQQLNERLAGLAETSRRVRQGSNPVTVSGVISTLRH
jgi:predicted RNase H-like nuclease (RuvC/YqgF family)